MMILLHLAPKHHSNIINGDTPTLICELYFLKMYTNTS